MIWHCGRGDVLEWSCLFGQIHVLSQQHLGYVSRSRAIDARDQQEVYRHALSVIALIHRALLEAVRAIACHMVIKRVAVELYVDIDEIDGRRLAWSVRARTDGVCMSM